MTLREREDTRRTRSHYLGNSLWNMLWACRDTTQWMIVTGLKFWGQCIAVLKTTKWFDINDGGLKGFSCSYVTTTKERYLISETKKYVYPKPLFTTLHITYHLSTQPPPTSIHQQKTQQRRHNVAARPCNKQENKLTRTNVATTLIRSKPNIK